MSEGNMISPRLTDHIDDAAALLAMLGNGKRLAIIGHLLEGELSVGAIAGKVALSQSALSQHLAKLRSLQLVDTRRDRQMIYYSCNSEAARKLIASLEEIYAEASTAHRRNNHAMLSDGTAD